MRHGKKDNHLGRTHSHRKAMLANMANSLIAVKRIETTLAKAKELRKYVEPLITKAKEDSTANRRLIFSYLQDKESIKSLFGEVAEKVANRNGGYTRIIKLGQRQGDNAETCLIEFVDYNVNLVAGADEDKAAKTRRGRRSGAKKSDSIPAAEVVESKPLVSEEAVATAPAEVETATTAVNETLAESADEAEKAI